MKEMMVKNRIDPHGDLPNPEKVEMIEIVEEMIDIILIEVINHFVKKVMKNQIVQMMIA